MAKRRLSKKVLQEDRESYAALQAITSYKPANAAFELTNIDVSFNAMNTKQTTEVQKKADAAAASDDAADSEYFFHNNVLGAKAQIAAQYGDDSNEYQSLGLKKKSEYNLGRRSPSNNNGGTT